MDNKVNLEINNRNAIEYICQKVTREHVLVTKKEEDSDKINVWKHYKHGTDLNNN